MTLHFALVVTFDIAVRTNAVPVLCDAVRGAYVAPNAVHDHGQLLLVAHVDHLLHDVVRVLVFHHREQRAGAIVLAAQHFVDELGAILPRSRMGSRN
jgi:hypothetical protein